MKAIRTKSILLLIICVLFGYFLISGPLNKVNAATQNEEVAQAYYRSQYRYSSTPNTFTATFKLDPLADGEVGQTNILYSNYAGSSSSKTVGYISIQINDKGNVRFNWNNAEKIVVFDVKDFRTGEFEHIAIVRDKETKSFKLYEEGKLIQEIVVGVGNDVTGSYAPAIGNDLRPTGDRYPFLGEIKDISVYTKALSGDEILDEYEITDKKTINKENNPNILFNWVLEGEASKLVYSETMPEWVTDYSGNENHAYLCTVFHWYDAPDNEWYKANEDEYTFVFYPDIQETVDFQKKSIYKQNEWVRDHAEDMNLKAVLTLGDLTNASFSHWHTTTDAFKIFDNANIPYVLTLGNHDYDDQTLTVAGGREAGHFNEFFEYEDFCDKEWFIDSKEPGALENAYYKFSGCDVNYLVFALEFGPSDSTLEWVSSIIEKPEYADYRVIILSHNIVGRSGYFTNQSNGANKYGFAKSEGVDVNTGEEMWDALLSKHDNIIMAAGGHVTGDTIMKRVDIGDNGNKVLSMLIDGQAVRDISGYRGASLILICKINEKTKKMTFNYYDPVKDLYFCVENQFEYDFSDIVSREITASECVDVVPYSKPGEIVTFTFDNTKNLYHEPIVKDKKGNIVEVIKTDGIYSFTMPEIGVDINVSAIHYCDFSLEVIDNKYLASEASCTSQAKYYYSCSCGLKGSETFEYGNKDEHIFDRMQVSSEYLASEATCLSQAKYYYSCSCGLKGTKTFEHGSLLEHTYSHDLKCIDDICLECENIKKGNSHNWSNGIVEVDATSDSAGKKVYTCSDCGAKMTEVIPQLVESGCQGSVIASIFGLIILSASLIVIRSKKRDLIR